MMSKYMVEHHQAGCLPDGTPSFHDEPTEAIEAWLEEIREAIEEMPNETVQDTIRYDGEANMLDRLAVSKARLGETLTTTGSVTYQVDSYIYEVSTVTE